MLCTRSVTCWLSVAPTALCLNLFCRQLAAAAHSLTQLATAAARALPPPGAAPQWLMQQVLPGCSVLSSCVALARRMLYLSAPTALKLGAAASLVFGPGQAALRGSMALATADPADPAAVGGLFALTSVQMAAVMGLVSELLDPNHQPHAAAAFASSTARPPALLPWLMAVSQAIPLATRWPFQGGLPASGASLSNQAIQVQVARCENPGSAPQMMS